MKMSVDVWIKMDGHETEYLGIYNSSHLNLYKLWLKLKPDRYMETLMGMDQLIVNESKIYVEDKFIIGKDEGIIEVKIRKKEHTKMSCIFCNYDKEEIIFENELALAIFDKCPVNEGHMLVIPKRHFSSFFEVNDEELLKIKELILMCKNKLDEDFKPDGYNVGINVGADAGQSIMHLHVHVIPRYKGDVEKPKGGVRNFKVPLVEY